MHSNGNGDAEAQGTGDHATLDGVAAHRLLGSSSVVCMGISTLLAIWDRLSAPDREYLLRRMAAHAATVDDGLKLLTRGHDPDRSLGATAQQH
jgi:hypothetical protein